MSKRKWRWVTRDEGKDFISIWHPWRPKPTQEYEVFFDGWFMNLHGATCINIHHDEFKKLTGITVPTDKPIKIEFTAKVVE